MVDQFLGPTPMPHHIPFFTTLVMLKHEHGNHQVPVGVSQGPPCHMVKNSFYRATPVKWDLCLCNESSPNLEVRATKRVAMGEAQPLAVVWNGWELVWHLETWSHFSSSLWEQKLNWNCTLEVQGIWDILGLVSFSSHLREQRLLFIALWKIKVFKDPAASMLVCVSTSNHLAKCHVDVSIHQVPAVR